MNATEWIETLGLEAADKEVLKGIAAKKPQAFDGYLMQSDYSRKMNELQADFDKKQREVDAFKNTLVDTRGKIDKQYKRAIEERNAAQAKLTTASARIKQVADENGLDYNEFGLDTAPAPAAAVPPVVPATHTQDPEEAAKYYTRDEAFNDATGHAMLLATFTDLTGEYQDLTGKRPAGATALMEKAVAALKEGKPVRFTELFDQHYGMTDLRKQAQEKAQAERDETIRRDERQKVMSEQMVNQTQGQTQNGNQSPALQFAAKHAAANAPANGGTPAADGMRRLRVAGLLQEEAVKAAS